MGVTDINYQVLNTGKQNTMTEYDKLKSAKESLNQQVDDFLTKYQGEGAVQLRQTKDTWMQTMTPFMEAVFELAVYLETVVREHGRGDAAAAARHRV